MSKPVVCFFMTIYNVEKYIRESIESILNQSEPNFMLFIYNNGCTDKTYDICKQYEKKDNRIIFIGESKVNGVFTDGERWYDNFNKYERHNSAKNVEYFAFLDPDDYYHPDFLKKMYKQVKEHNADMIACGTTMFLEENPKRGSYRIPPALVLKEKKIECQQFIDLYGTLRPIWGKLYSINLFDKFIDIIKNRPDFFCSGADTYNVLSLMLEIDTFVSIDESLHFYRIRKGSASNGSIISIGRIKEAGVLFQLGAKYAEVYGVLNKQVVNFLGVVYLNHIKDALNLAVDSIKMTVEEKINLFQDILLDEIFCELMATKSNESIALEMICGLLDKVLSRIPSIEKVKFEKYFVVRLIKEYSNNNIESHSEVSINLLSILCDKCNRYNWGSTLNKNLPMINYNNIEQIIEIINGQEVYEVNELKIKILDYVDEQDYEKSKKEIERLLKMRPLDREGMYFKIYVDYMLGELESAVTTAIIAKTLWEKDEDMLGLYNELVEKV